MPWITLQRPKPQHSEAFSVPMFHPSTVPHSHRPAKAEIRLHTASQWGQVTLTHIKEKPVLKMLSGVLGTPHINKTGKRPRPNWINIWTSATLKRRAVLTGIWPSWSKFLRWHGSMGLPILPLWAVGRASTSASVRERIQFENCFRLKSFQNWTI